MEIEALEKKNNYQFTNFFKKLWNDGMIDWYRGWDEPFSPERNWQTEIYPKIKNKPPILLHSGVDFEMLSHKQMLNYEFLEWWNIDKHHFIPFGQSGAGDLYAFYKNITINGENPVVMVWHDDDKTDILSKNFEDFIFRQFLEKLCYYDTEYDDLDNIRADFSTMKNYFKDEYVTVLEPLLKQNISKIKNYLTEEKMTAIFKKTIDFKYFDTSFNHEIPEN